MQRKSRIQSPLVQSKISYAEVFIPIETHWIWIPISTLWRPQLRLYSLKGAEQMYQPSPPHWPRKWGQATGRENTPPGHSLIAQMKKGKQNLERVYFYLWLCVFQLFSSSFKINRMAVSIFVKNWLVRPPTVYCSFFIFLEGKVCFRGF